MPDPRAPKGLGTAGRLVWRRTLAAVADGWELDERDLLVLEQAGRQGDLIADLEAAIERDGLSVKGAAGQDRLNAAVPALNAARALLGRLLAQIQIAPPAPRTGLMSGRQRANVKRAALRKQARDG